MNDGNKAWTIAAALRWLFNRPGLVLLTAGDEALSREPATRFRYGWIDMFVVSAALGVLVAVVWGGAWRLFGELSGVLVMPALLTTLAMLLLMYRRAAAMVDIFAGPDTTHKSLGAALLVVGLMMCMLALGRKDHDTTHWYAPDVRIYRVLVLMPVWGWWSMLILGQFCRPGKNTEPAIEAFFNGCGPLTAAVCWAVPLAWSSIYFQYLPWTQFAISGAATIAAILGGAVLCRLGGGLDRKTLQAVNLLTQIVFLLAFLAVANGVF